MKDINATVIVDLKGSEEDIFNRLQKDARWGVKKAQKSGLMIEESRDFVWMTRGLITQCFFRIFRRLAFIFIAPNCTTDCMMIPEP